MVERRYIIPSRIHPAFSLIGRRIGKRCGDSLQAESLHIAATVLVGVVLVLAQALSWTIFPHALSQDLSFLVGAFVVFVALFLAGRQPEISVEMHSDALVVKTKPSGIRIPLGGIDKTSIIAGQLYYRHYRRFARTRAYVNRIPATVLLIETAEGPVVLGISESDQQELIDLLARTAAPFEVA
jgi:hypothetical protein